MAVSAARARTRRTAAPKASSTRLEKRSRSTSSWPKAWMVRAALRLSSTWAPTSATRSWLVRDSRRTRRPMKMIGPTTAGTKTMTIRASLGLVTTSMTKPPTSSSRLRMATEAEEPITTCKSVVSVVMRERMSPTRVVSKNAGSRVSTWAKTSLRISATTRSPSQETSE